MQTMRTYLEEHPFFEGLRDEHLELLSGCAKNIRVESDEYFIRTGKEANYFYLIRHGKAALELYHPNRGPIIVQTMHAGEVLGWSWLLPPFQWHFDVRAVEFMRLVALDGECLRTKCEEDHELGYEILKRFTHIITARLHATRIQLLDLYNG